MEESEAYTMPDCCVFGLRLPLHFPIIGRRPRSDSQTNPTALRLALSGGVPHPPPRSDQDLQPYCGENSKGSLRDEDRNAPGSLTERVNAPGRPLFRRSRLDSTCQLADSAGSPANGCPAGMPHARAHPSRTPGT